LIPVIGGEFMPETDQGHIQIYIEARRGTPVCGDGKISDTG